MATIGGNLLVAIAQATAQGPAKGRWLLDSATRSRTCHPEVNVLGVCIDFVCAHPAYNHKQQQAEAKRQVHRPDGEKPPL